MLVFVTTLRNCWKSTNGIRSTWMHVRVVSPNMVASRPENAPLRSVFNRTPFFSTSWMPCSERWLRLSFHVGGDFDSDGYRAFVVSELVVAEGTEAWNERMCVCCRL